MRTVEEQQDLKQLLTQAGCLQGFGVKFWLWHFENTSHPLHSGFWPPTDHNGNKKRQRSGNA